MKRRQRKREAKRDAQLAAAVRKLKAGKAAKAKRDRGRLLGGRW